MINDKYIQLKNMFNEQACQWQKQNVKRVSICDQDFEYKLKIETMLISAKTQYNLNKILNKLYGFIERNKILFENVVNKHLFYCNMSSWSYVVWNFLMIAVLVMLFVKRLIDLMN